VSAPPDRSTRKSDRGGSAAVEFALIGPILIAVLLAAVVYGGGFLMAQSVQSLASEAARASIGGLDAAERALLAEEEARAAARDIGALDASRLSVRVEDDGVTLRVVAAYDIHDHPIMLLAAMLPRPPETIERAAAVRFGER
jgi:Flp pilus assembly protein TadG